VLVCESVAALMRAGFGAVVAYVGTAVWLVVVDGFTTAVQSWLASEVVRVVGSDGGCAGRDRDPDQIPARRRT